LLKKRELFDMNNAAFELYANELITRDELVTTVALVRGALMRGEWCREW